MKFISSRDNPFFKKMIKLAGSAQQRRATGLTLLDGIHLVAAYHIALGQPEALIMSESGRESAEIKRLLEEWKPREGLSLVVLSDLAVSRGFSSQDSDRYHGAGTHPLGRNHPHT